MSIDRCVNNGGVEQKGTGSSIGSMYVPLLSFKLLRLRLME